MRLLALSVCALALISGSSNAQQVSRSETRGPTLQSAALGFHVSQSKVDASTRVTSSPCCRHQGQDVALMAVGVGAMIAGALIDNNTASTIIIIGGAAMALYGLYHYLE